VADVANELSPEARAGWEDWITGIIPEPAATNSGTILGTELDVTGYEDLFDDYNVNHSWGFLAAVRVVTFPTPFSNEPTVRLLSPRSYEEFKEFTTVKSLPDTGYMIMDVTKNGFKIVFLNFVARSAGSAEMGEHTILDPKVPVFPAFLYEARGN
jgi:hypothetical protein